MLSLGYVARNLNPESTFPHDADQHIFHEILLRVLIRCCLPRNKPVGSDQDGSALGYLVPTRKLFDRFRGYALRVQDVCVEGNMHGTCGVSCCIGPVGAVGANQQDMML